MGTKFQLLTVCLKCKCWTSLVVQWLRIHLPATLACDGHTLSVECVCVCARAHMCVFGGASLWEGEIVLGMNGADGSTTSECI